ncbi:MAG: ectoine hydroxylase-related dioxygenase (phytanoyl-CoA dioxygenase family) [Verrucomicrobiales bacterium]|jgi:ectoine hydroxylase-related dioxygenase (phytanoyl-CoA dioxygenase family)
MTLTHFAASTDPVVVSDHLAAHGYAIIDELVSNELLDLFAAEAASHIEASRGGGDDYDGAHTRRTGALIAKVPASRELVMHPVALAVAEGLLSQASAIQLLLTQIITIDPGETQQKLHRDQMMFDLYPFPPNYHVQCNTMWALTDFTIENGATHICPSSSGATDEQAASIEPLQAEMKRGSVLFYEGKVLHGGGANTSDSSRQGINITYGIGWVRQEENQYLACPPEIARTLDDDLLRMMGYQQGAFSLGYVGDQEDPLAVLRGENQRASRIAEFADASDAHRAFVDDIDGVGSSN